MIKQLLDVIKDYEHIYIQPHNIPDPDAIASSFGLAELLKSLEIKTTIIYADSIEKANSKKMLEMFNIEMVAYDSGFELGSKDLLVLVDTQLGNANVTVLGEENVAVIDHHNMRDEDGYVFKDLRPQIGACSAIIASYFEILENEPSTDVATALLYGIMTDTDNLTRNNNKLDVDMFYRLYNRADFSKIKDLRMNEIGKDDIYAYAKALQNIEIYGPVGFIHIEDCNDSLLGTISDMVYTIEGVAIVISYAKRIEGIKFSIRSGLKKIKANLLVQYLLQHYGVGGGHDEMAGGFIKKEAMTFLENKDLDTYVRYRVLSYLEKESSL